MELALTPVIPLPSQQNNVEFPYLALLVSGGHTALLHVTVRAVPGLPPTLHVVPLHASNMKNDCTNTTEPDMLQPASHNHR